MAISHAKSVTIADFTGTVTVFNSAGATTTANATDIVRPSNWNSAHDQYFTLSGNTAGASTLSGSNIVFQGGNNVTLSGNGSTIVFSGPTQTAFVLSNSNGISFGTNGSTVTASHNGLTTQSNQAFSAAGGSSAFQTLVFANSNGVSFSNSNGSVVGSVETAYAASTHSHGNPSLALTNISGTTASASNGLTLSLSAAAPGAVTLTQYATGNTTQSSSGTIAGSSVIVRGSGGVSAGISNGSVIVEGPALTSLSVTGALSASSNGSTISLGVGTVTMSATSNTTQGSSGTVNLNALILHGAGGASVGISNGSIVISGAAGGGGGGGGVGLGVSTMGNTAGTTGTVTTGNVALVGSGVISLSQSSSGSNATISILAPATSSLSATGAVSLSTNGSTISVGVGTVTVSATSNTTQNSSGTINLAGMVLHGAGIASVGLSNGSVVISVPSGGGAGDGVNILAAGTQTAATTGTVLFNNSNGITFGMSNSSVITASHNGLTTARASNDAVGLNTAQSNVTWTVNSSGISLDARGYAGTASGFTGGASISGSMTHNSDGLSLSLSHPAWLTTAALSNHSHAFSAAGGSSAFQTLSFSNGNGATFTNTNGQVGLSYSVPVVSNAIQPVGSATGSGTNVSRFAADDHVHEGVFSVGVSTGGNTAGNTRVGAGRFVLAGGANITLSQATAAGGLNTVSIVGPSGGGAAISAGANSQSTGTVNFANSNGITFGLSNNGTLTASYNSTQFAGQGTTTAGANISLSMTLNSVGLNLSASVAAPGAAAENNAHNLLGANTAGNTTATGSTIGLSGVNITLSGTNASQIVISAPATSSLTGWRGLSVSTAGSTISVGMVPESTYIPYYPASTSSQTHGALGTSTASAWVFPVSVVIPVAFNELRILQSASFVSSTISGQQSISSQWGLFSMNGSTLSQISTGSMSMALTVSSVSATISFATATATTGYGYGTVTASTTAQAQSLFGSVGNRVVGMQFGNSMSLEPGLYWLGLHQRQSTSSAAVGISTALVGNVFGAAQSVAPFGTASSAITTSPVYHYGWGVHTSTGLVGHSGTNLPSSMALSGIANTIAVMPMVTFIST